jgi:hypothetical protein
MITLFFALLLSVALAVGLVTLSGVALALQDQHKYHLPEYLNETAKMLSEREQQLLLLEKMADLVLLNADPDFALSLGIPQEPETMDEYPHGEICSPQAPEIISA